MNLYMIMKHILLNRNFKVKIGLRFWSYNHSLFFLGLIDKVCGDSICQSIEIILKHDIKFSKVILGLVNINFMGFQISHA